MHVPRTKQRHANHKKGDRGVALVTDKFPDDWVVRDIRPDYGLDLHVEVFEPDKHDPDSANTLGEHFYVQVKSVERLDTQAVIVRERRNVAKYAPDPNEGEPLEIGVVKFQLDTATLLTVETMGAAVPVVLCVVDLSTANVYYVCLNDYLSKVLLPYKPAYEEQASVTLTIPAWNVLDADDPSFAYFWLLARRAKFYAAFSTFAYQYHELQYARIEHPTLPDEADGERTWLSPELLTMARTFLRSALRLAIWEPTGPGFWAPLGDVAEALQFVKKCFPPEGAALPAEDVARWEHYLIDAFRRADNLGRMYEELVREWHLPTAMAALVDHYQESKYSPTAVHKRSSVTD